MDTYKHTIKEVLTEDDIILQSWFSISKTLENNNRNSAVYDCIVKSLINDYNNMEACKVFKK